MQLVERPRWDQLCMDVARMVASRSTCSRLQVGCVITTPDHSSVLAWGYNGGARGQGNECESTVPGMCGHVHAEVNAAIKAPCGVPKNIYVTHLPCLVCAKVLVNLGGIEHLAFAEPYRIADSLDVLLRAGITVTRTRRDGSMTIMGPGLYNSDPALAKSLLLDQY